MVALLAVIAVTGLVMPGGLRCLIDQAQNIIIGA
jgi:hypothetical protein